MKKKIIIMIFVITAIVLVGKAEDWYTLEYHHSESKKKIVSIVNKNNTKLDSIVTRLGKYEPECSVFIADDSDEKNDSKLISGRLYLYMESSMNNNTIIEKEIKDRELTNFIKNNNIDDVLITNTAYIFRMNEMVDESEHSYCIGGFYYTSDDNPQNVVFDGNYKLRKKTEDGISILIMMTGTILSKLQRASIIMKENGILNIKAVVFNSNLLHAGGHGQGALLLLIFTCSPSPKKTRTDTSHVTKLNAVTARGH